MGSSANFSQEISGGAVNNVNDNGKLLLAVAVLIVLVVAGVLFFKFKSAKTENATLSPTVTPTETLTPTAVLTPAVSATPSVTATPTLSVKQQIKIQILNGTGARGEAAFLKTKLTGEGYGTFTVGNADNASSDAQTQVTFYAGFPQNLRVDLVSFLQTLYATVSSQVSTGSSNFDAVVTTGQKK